MPRRRRKPLRTRITYYVQVGTDVVQAKTLGTVTLGRDEPLLFTRKAEAEELARRTGGTLNRLTKHRRFKPIDTWWADRITT